MDTAQWPEGIGVVKSMEEKKPRPQKPQALNCPRCNSTHTKFCYYNNYSLSQPRYFCKTCRRYWTEGGSLRNVPVGGGSRKNKRSSPAVSSKKLPDHHHMAPPSNFSQNPNKIHEGQDLNLAYPPTGNYTSTGNTMSGLVELPYNQDNKTYHPNTTSSSASPQFSAMEFLKSGIASRGIMNSLMPMPMPMPMQMQMQMPMPMSMPMPVSDSNTMIYSSAGLNFSLDGFESGYNGNLQAGVQENSTSSARLFFPFEELKPTSTEVLDQNRGQGDSNGYWNGGGSW